MQSPPQLKRQKWFSTYLQPPVRTKSKRTHFQPRKHRNLLKVREMKGVGHSQNPSRSKPPIGAEGEPDGAEQEATPTEPSIVETPKQQSGVEFFQPELGDTKRKDRSRIMITGQAPPQSQILLADDQILFFTANNQMGDLPLAEVLVGSRRVTAGDNGLFELILDLPREKIQINLKVKTPDGVIATYQLNLEVGQKDVLIKGPKALKQSPLYTKKYGMWFGTGFNFLQYKQASGDISADLQFQTFKGPSFFGKGWWKVNDRLDASFTAKMSPGEVTSSSDIQISEGNYNWLIFALEGTYYPKKWRQRFLEDYPVKWGVRFGIQHHIVPFISRTGASVTEAEIATNTLSMFTIGVQSNLQLTPKWIFEWFLRYQSPLASGSTFDIRPDFAFDGSLGLIHVMRGSWRIGGFWYGQWHDYSFTHRDRYLVNQSSPDPMIDGRQSLFFSNVEIRLGYEFN